MRACTAGVKQCCRVCVCVCVYVLATSIENPSSRVARTFKMLKNNPKKKTNKGTFLYLTQVKAVLFAIISATSYYRFLRSTHFQDCTWYLRSALQLQLCAHENTGVCRINLACRQCVHNQEACRVSIPWIHSSFSVYLWVGQCVHACIFSWVIYAPQEMSFVVQKKSWPSVCIVRPCTAVRCHVAKCCNVVGLAIQCNRMYLCNIY